ncbi:hypothetical protein EVAR_99180_1 [Eumeta japonica]|uniref:Uncharacterized protein n=1 Tax=Eumeta variegata TaxID=151549 RepID=A0A4C1YPF7_EUMVA|nr:hypothetical protein EVAR_99180_1 [Eumeta japonica]
MRKTSADSRRRPSGRRCTGSHVVESASHTSDSCRRKLLSHYRIFVAYRLQNLNVLANSITPTQPAAQLKPKKDAYMQTDPVENEDTLHCNSASDSENYSPTIYEKNDYIENQHQNITYEETKTEEYIQNEEEKYIQNEEEKYIQNEEEKYILERKLQEQYARTVEYDKIDIYKEEYQYQKEENYQKMPSNTRTLTYGSGRDFEESATQLTNATTKELPYPQDQVELFGGQRLVGDHRLVAQQPKTDYYETQIKTEPDLHLFHAISTYPQENADSHIHQGIRSAKTTRRCYQPPHVTSRVMNDMSKGGKNLGEHECYMQRYFAYLIVQYIHAPKG